MIAHLLRYLADVLLGFGRDKPGEGCIIQNNGDSRSRKSTFTRHVHESDAVRFRLDCRHPGDLVGKQQSIMNYLCKATQEYFPTMEKLGGGPRSAVLNRLNLSMSDR